MSDDQCRTFGDLLRHHCHAVCLTQAELAERAGACYQEAGVT